MEGHMERIWSQVSTDVAIHDSLEVQLMSDAVTSVLYSTLEA